MKQYDIVIVNLNPTKGSEIKKIRPCVIISPNDSNEFLETLIVCPITSKRRKYPTRINFKLKGKKNSIAIDQIRTVDESRVVKKVGRLRKKRFSENFCGSRRWGHRQR